MIVIRLDKRVFLALLGVVGILVALAGGFFLGRVMNSTGASSAASAARANPPAAAPAQPPMQSVPLNPQQAPAPGAAQAQVQPPPDNIPRISVTDAAQKVGRPDVVFVDSRIESEFKSGHIKGAISVPVGETQTRLSQLPKDKDIIIYCA